MFLSTRPARPHGARRPPAASALVFVVLAAVVLAITSGCSKSPQSLVPNQSPTITLTSGPVDTVTTPLSWLVEIAWTASDPDGSIDRFEYAVDPPNRRQALTANAETAWVATRETRVTVRFRASSPDSAGPGATASDFHTFVLRAVDDDGAISPRIVRAFYAYTVAPDVRITNPVASPLLEAQIGVPFRLTWSGHDPDGAGTTAPVSYWVRILDLNITGEGMPFLLDPDSLRRQAIRTNWEGWLSVPGESSSVVLVDQRLVPGSRAIAAVAAVDEAGASTPYMSYDRNLLTFSVLFNAAPAIHLTSPYIDYRSDAGQQPSTVGFELPSDRPVTMRWEGVPSPGRRVVSSRWMLDGNITDPTPRSDEATDWVHWSEPAGPEGTATFGPLLPGDHFLYIELRDDLGSISMFTFRPVSVPLSFHRELLVVNDTRFEVDKFVNDPQRRTPDVYTRAWPSRTELDTFLFARGGFPWRGTKNPPSGVTSTPGLLAGYSFDTLGTRLGLEDPASAVLLSRLANYRHVLWMVDAAAAQHPWPNTTTFPVTALRVMCSPGHANALAAYVQTGGRVWLAGGGAAYASLVAFDRPENNTVGIVRFDFAHGELIPGRMMYDVGHVRSELSVSSAPTVPERSAAARGGWSGHGPDGTLAAPDYARLPVQLRPRSPDTDPMPPTRLASQTALFYTQNGTQEYISAPNEIVEDMDADPTVVRLEATLDSLYESSHSSFSTPRAIVMTYYHGREHAPFVFTGLPLWAWTVSDAQGLVDFVLQDIWGLARSGAPARAAAVTATSGRSAAPARASSSRRR